MLYLASQSARRAELLSQIGVLFQKLNIDVDESQTLGEQPIDYVLRLACEKSACGWQQSTQSWPVLGADTIVVIGEQILGKPRDHDDARKMLSLLAGNTHQVYTAVTLTTAQGQVHTVVNTTVTFGKITLQQIDDYWASGEPQDKAGSYGIQGLGGQFVKHINGSYSAVVGLPLYETRQLLNQIGYQQ